MAGLLRAGRALRGQPEIEIIATLARVSGRWCDRSFPHRVEAERALAQHYEVPKSAIATILDAAFQTWTRNALRTWVRSELGSEAVLDDPSTAGNRRLARGPELLGVLAARGVPTTPVGDVVAGLLVKAPMWIKIASGADDLTRRFVVSLAEEDEMLGEAIEVVEERTREAGEWSLLEAATTILATGRRQTLEDLRGRLRPDQRWIEHGPRMSVAAIARRRVVADPAGVARRLAWDTAFAGQLGCLSPSVAYVDSEYDVVSSFAQRVLGACQVLWPARSDTGVSLATRAAMSEARAALEVEVASGSVRVLGQPGEGWSVVVRAGNVPPEPPQLLRCLTLVSVPGLEGLPALLAERRGAVAAVGVDAPPAEFARLVGELASAGVERVTPLGRMQRPPADWRRDGRPTLCDLVTWVDFDG